MRNVIYYRKSLMDADELAAASKYFDCVDLISDIKPGDFVIPRFASYPYPLDMQREFKNIGATAINSHQQYLYIADLQNYVADLGELTPKTWDKVSDIPEIGQYVLKGETNSKKARWLTDMYAANKRDAIEVHSRLCSDTLISYQNIYVREYIPLFTYFLGIGGIPVTKEFRFFIAYGQVISSGYYWANYAEDLEVVPSADEVPREFLDKVISRVGKKSNFYVVDVAQTATGEWIVIELNDGCSSGLSCNDPDNLYCNLREALNTTKA